MTPPGPDRPSSRLVFRKPPEGLRERLEFRRRARMVAGVIVGPAIGTAIFMLIVTGLLALMGRVLSMEQSAAGFVAHFVVWEIIAIVWLHRNWREPGAGGGT